MKHSQARGKQSKARRQETAKQRQAELDTLNPEDKKERMLVYKIAYDKHGFNHGGAK